VKLTEFSIRCMELADLEAVSLIEQWVQVVPWTKNIFIDCLRAGYQGFIVERRQEVVGFVLFTFAAGECHILNIAISPLEQSQGIGYWLMQYVLNHLKQLSASSVFLEVRASNRKAQALYKKLQFKEIGQRKGYYQAKQGREDAIVMSLELANLSFG